jgi:hypothetical protein
MFFLPLYYWERSNTVDSTVFNARDVLFSEVFFLSKYIVSLLLFVPVASKLST